MFLGHIGAAFAARSRWQETPVPLLIGATLLPDIVRLVLGVAGVDIDPANIYSHTAPWLVYQVVIAGLLVAGFSRRASDGKVVAGLVLLHVVFDFMSGTKWLWPGGPPGFNLNDAGPVELLFELAFLLTGWSLMRSLRKRRTWTISVLGTLTAIQLLIFADVVRHRPDEKRCLVYPLAACGETGVLSRRFPSVSLATLLHLN